MFCPDCDAPVIVFQGIIHTAGQGKTLGRVVACASCALVSEVSLADNGVLVDLGDITLADLEDPHGFSTVLLMTAPSSQLHWRES